MLPVPRAHVEGLHQDPLRGVPGPRPLPHATVFSQSVSSGCGSELVSPLGDITQW